MKPEPGLAMAAALLCAATAAPAQTQQAPGPLPGGTAPPSAAVDRIEITGRHYDNAVGSSDAASQGVIRAELLKSRPALRPAEVLEFVPGMIVTQHSGDGKANQYFLRGFNLDHGTDFATTIDGLPVNMPSHAHGQGYTDLNFLIPELVDRIAYSKGPYFARNGDFASAGSADIAYRRRLDAPVVQLSAGQRGYARGVAAASTSPAPGLQLLGALELQRNDGPWTVPEGLHKTNAVLRLSGGDAAQGFSASLMAYQARWTATDQVPQRLIDAGTWQGQPFGRFDSLDPTDGGDTRRSCLSGEWHRQDEAGTTRLLAYAIDYRMKLFSNFTYALERPADGDQFSQQDRRRVYGLKASHSFDHGLAGLPARSELGLQLRQDRIRVGLFDSVARQISATTRDDQVRETMLGLYGQTAVELTPWLRGIAGLRADAARFRVDSLSLAANSGQANDQLLSPKLSLVAGPWARSELFFNAGRGFHSNDARGTTASIDPRSGEPVDKVPGLVASRGFEVGARSEWIPGLQTSLALWRLDFDSELVYVGDAGSTEPNRPSTRRGVEWNNRWVPTPWLLVDADLAWTHARFATPDPAGDFIPNSVEKVASVAVTLRDRGPWSASLQWRYLGAGALIEDDSVRSNASLTTNLRAGYRFARDSELTLDVFNLFDRQVNDIEYFYTSRLPGEPAGGVDDRHVHAAEPRTLRLTLRLGF
ncbi:MAG: TonB-dependent receptor [Burkholderiaceae bacterium]|nr:TonB-dependent receptor [Burkholderiaceae bacterium]